MNKELNEAAAKYHSEHFYAPTMMAFHDGAASDAARDYWFAQFKEKNQVLSDEELTGKISEAFDAGEDYGTTVRNNMYNDPEDQEDLPSNKGQYLLKSALNTYSADGWISVEEILPTYDKLKSIEIMALCGNAHYFLDFITGENGVGKFYLSISYPTRIFHDCTMDVTHWQPLPSPPINADGYKEK